MSVYDTNDLIRIIDDLQDIIAKQDELIQIKDDTIAEMCRAAEIDRETISILYDAIAAKDQTIQLLRGQNYENKSQYIN